MVNLSYVYLINIDCFILWDFVSLQNIFKIIIIGQDGNKILTAPQNMKLKVKRWMQWEISNIILVQKDNSDVENLTKHDCSKSNEKCSFPWTNNLMMYQPKSKIIT